MSKVIAFIPARGGSKSIPMKNIKLFCGKPLIYWTAKAAQLCPEVDKVIVSTDSYKIESTVKQFGFSKIHIHHRSAENAKDNSSTESVILEYIKSEDNLNDEDIFLLIQATSPLLEAINISRGIEKLKSFDSFVSCVRTKRFYWNEQGKALNYDIFNRPRRQEFNGQLVENGAIYGSTIGNIRKYNNRISKSIAILEMDEDTLIELDEPNDWIVAEALKNKRLYQFNHSLKDGLKKIKLVISDVDGVLTDGGMYYSENGDELKKFNTRDGMGFQILREYGIKTGIITSEMTALVKRRAEKLKVDYCYQKRKNEGKLKAISEICKKENLELADIAYIGDDINCFEALSSVGIAACPKDANFKIKNIPNINILPLNGGDGVFRFFVDKLINQTV